MHTHTRVDAELHATSPLADVRWCYRRPQLLEQTLSDARKMAANLDGLWDNLELLVLNPTQYLK